MGGSVSKRKGTKVSSQMISERRRSLIKVILLIRHDMRLMFGLKMMGQWGYFIDVNLSRIIHAFFTFYPRGMNRVLKKSDPIAPLINCMSVSNDGSYLYTGCDGGFITKWDLFKQTKVKTTDRLRRRIACLVHGHKDGLLCSAMESWIHIWDDQSLEMIRKLDEHSGKIFSMIFTREGDKLVSAGWTMTVWMVDTWECVFKLNEVGHGHVHSMTSVYDNVHTKQGVILSAATGSKGKDLKKKKWEIKECSVSDTSGRIRSLKKGTRVTTCMRMYLISNCDGSLLAHYWSDLDGVSIVEWPTLRTLRDIIVVCPGSFSLCACFHPIHPDLLCISDSRNIRMYLAKNGKRVASFDTRAHGYAHCLCFTPDGTRLISAMADGSIHLWDVSHLM